MIRALAFGACDAVLLGWLNDQPQDALVNHVSFVLGEDTLVSAAEAAESAGEIWLAACRWAAGGCGGYVTHVEPR